MYDATMTADVIDKTSPVLIQNKPARICKGCQNWRTIDGRSQQVEIEWLSIHGLCSRCQNRPGILAQIRAEWARSQQRLAYV